MFYYNSSFIHINYQYFLMSKFICVYRQYFIKVFTPHQFTLFRLSYKLEEIIRNLYCLDITCIF